MVWFCIYSSGGIPTRLNKNVHPSQQGLKLIHQHCVLSHSGDNAICFYYTCRASTLHFMSIRWCFAFQHYFMLGEAIPDHIHTIVLLLMIFRDFSGHRARVADRLLLYVLVFSKFYPSHAFNNGYRCRWCVEYCSLSQYVFYGQWDFWETLEFLVFNDFARHNLLAWVMFFELTGNESTVEILANGRDSSVHGCARHCRARFVYDNQRALPNFWWSPSVVLVLLYGFFAVPISAIIVALYYRLILPTSPSSFSLLLFIYIFTTSPRWLIYQYFINKSNLLFSTVIIFLFIARWMFRELSRRPYDHGQ